VTAADQPGPKDEGPQEIDLIELGGDEPARVECPSCGAEISEEAQRCPHCGQYVVNTAENSSAGWWWVAPIAAAAALLIWLTSC